MKLLLIGFLFCFCSCNGQELTSPGVNVYTKSTIDSMNAATQITLNALATAVATIQPLRDSLNALKATVAAIKPVYFQGFVGDGLTPLSPIMPPPCPCKQ